MEEQEGPGAADGGDAAAPAGAANGAAAGGAAAGAAGAGAAIGTAPPTGGSITFLQLLRQ